MTLQAELAPRLSTPTQVRAVILLAGRVGRHAFADAIERPALHLPVGPRSTLRDLWLAHLRGLAGDLAAESGGAPLRVVVAATRGGPAPLLRPLRATAALDVTVVRDRTEYRGTAGVVRDLTRRLGREGSVLVLIASQIPREPLRRTVAALRRAGEGVAVTRSGASDVATAFLLDCRRLESVPDEGFVDLKEQAISPERSRVPLAVVRRPDGAALPMRTLEEYLLALRTLRGPAPARDVPGSRAHDDPYAESWRPAFAIAESGANVEPGAVLHDSVVLAGGRVEAGAVVARSVVAPRAVVRRGSCVVGAIVTEAR